MALCKRLIARLDVKGSKLIKGIRFEGLRVVGDPWEAACRYAEAGADELLYVDVVASLYGRNGLVDLLRRTRREVFIPITAGGGVRSVSDAAALLAAGADKIAVNTAALQRPELITELAEAFGRQCVVASIQARRFGVNSWEAMAEAGRERTGRDVLSWIEAVQQSGAGEILITSVDQDGTCMGPDLNLLRAAANLTRVPLVFGGGFGKVPEVCNALQDPGIAAIAIATAFHKNQFHLAELKKTLAAVCDQIQIRQPMVQADEPKTIEVQLLQGVKVGIIDYGMGNQQSLINAFERLGAVPILASDPDQLEKCDLLSLPGVGSFPKGMSALQARGLDNFLRRWVATNRPLLGICLGMQLLFESSEEFGFTNGFGFIDGHVASLPTTDVSGSPLVIPHMGWNKILPGPASGGQESYGQAFQFFVHSYAVIDTSSEHIMFHCDYGGRRFVAAVCRGPIAGLQFHPELSGYEGLRLLAALCNKLMAS